MASYKLEEHGETFSVLASDIRKNAKENDALITNVHHTVEALSASLNEIIFLISCTSLQMEMIKFFIKELVDKSETRLEQSVNVLYALVASYNESLMKLPRITSYNVCYTKLLRLWIQGCVSICRTEKRTCTPPSSLLR